MHGYTCRVRWCRLGPPALNGPGGMRRGGSCLRQLRQTWQICQALYEAARHGHGPPARRRARRIPLAPRIPPGRAEFFAAVVTQKLHLKRLISAPCVFGAAKENLMVGTHADDPLKTRMSKKYLESCSAVLGLEDAKPSKICGRKVSEEWDLAIQEEPKPQNIKLMQSGVGKLQFLRQEYPEIIFALKCKCFVHFESE